jgi:acyl-CoA synthetase (AMP-forming)/AMP-acid ligase II
MTASFVIGTGCAAPADAEQLFQLKAVYSFWEKVSMDTRPAKLKRGHFTRVIDARRCARPCRCGRCCRAVYCWITDGVDDVINVSGHRMGTAEVESSLVAHDAVSEAAVVGYPHDIKGQGIYAYVTLMTGTEPSETLRKELVAWVRKDIGPIASPDFIQFAPGLPKTRSGKIMRRILRKIAEDEPSSLGDTSTLADPAVVDDLVSNRQNKKGAGA